MAWLGLVGAILKLLNGLTGYFRDKKLIDAGAAAQAKGALDAALDAIRKANDARAAADRSNADPGRLRNDDGFKRD